MHLSRHEIKKSALRDWTEVEDKTSNLRKSKKYMKVNVNTEQEGMGFEDKKGKKRKNFVNSSASRQATLF